MPSARHCARRRIELARRLPLQVFEEADALGVLARRIRPPLRPAGIAVCSSGQAGQPQTCAIGLVQVLLQCLEQGVLLQRLAAVPREIAAAPSSSALRGAEAAIQQLEDLELGRRHAGVIDQRRRRAARPGAAWKASERTRSCAGGQSRKSGTASTSMYSTLRCARDEGL